MEVPMSRSFSLMAGCLVVAALAFAVAAPPIVSIGIALFGVLSLFAPRPFRFPDHTPRSIFETRRMGLG